MKHRTLDLVLIFSVACAASIPVAHAQATGCALTTTRFVADGNNVNDTLTGLVWSRCNLSRKFDPTTYKCTGSAYTTDSLDAAKQTMPVLSRESGGAWRLPTIAELRAVFDEKCSREDQRKSPFSTLDGTPLWSSSTDASGKVWQLDREGNNGRPEYYTVEIGAATIVGVRDAKR
jgi:hypothetical protein